MTYCQSCGSPVEGKFCAKCGAAAGQNAGPFTGPSSTPPAGTGAGGLADNVASALCYIPIIGVIFLLIEPYNRNKLIRFHAFQSLFLVALMFVVNIVLASVMEIVWGFWGVFGLLRLAFFVLWLFLIIKTFQGQKVVLPIIGALAEKQA